MSTHYISSFIDFTRTRFKQIIISLLVVAFICYVEESLKTHQKYEKPFDVKCRHFAIHRQEVIRITQHLHDTLERHNVTHFLIYGSVWSSLRGYHGPLPWDSDVDFGTLYSEEIKSKMKVISGDMERHDISVQKPNDGLYRFLSNHPPVRIHPNESPVVDIFLFKPTLFGLTRRMGRETWLLFIHYYYHHTFPHRLVSGDLPKVRFADRMISVPKNGLEVMKHLYRYSWWKVQKPPGYNCSDEEILSLP